MHFPDGSMQSAGQEQVPGTTPIDQGTCTPMDVAHEADVNVAHSMPPPSPHASAPTTPKTPQGMSTPRSVSLHAASGDTVTPCLVLLWNDAC